LHRLGGEAAFGPYPPRARAEAQRAEVEHKRNPSDAEQRLRS